MSRSPTQQPRFIVFEGLDGSGKSTCARAVAERLGAVFLTTPSPTLRELRGKIIDDLGDCQEAHELFYLATVFAASNEVTRHLAEGRSVVLDRYFLSTVAYAAFRGSTLDVDDLAAALRPADLTVYLHADLAVRRARVQRRGGTVRDYQTLIPANDEALQSEHTSRFDLGITGRVLLLDSGTLSPQQLAGAIVDELAA